MDDVLAGRGVRLTYLRDPSLIAAAVDGRVLDDVAPVGRYGSVAWALRPRLLGLHHLVLATGSHTGQSVGLFAARDLTTATERFLSIETAMVAPGFETLPNRMLALVITRGAEIDNPPAAIVVDPGNAAMVGALRAAERSIAGAAFDCGWDDVVVRLRAAALLRRIVRVIGPGPKPAVLDLRSVDKDALTEGAARLYRGRSRRKGKPRPCVDG